MITNTFYMPDVVRLGPDILAASISLTHVVVHTWCIITSDAACSVQAGSGPRAPRYIRVSP